MAPWRISSGANRFKIESVRRDSKELVRQADIIAISHALKYIPVLCPG